MCQSTVNRNLPTLKYANLLIYQVNGGKCLKSKSLALAVNLRVDRNSCFYKNKFWNR